jgi:hypothetical protein
MSQDHDWVREQLSALPRPTLPEEVAQRLDQAIAAEPRASVDGAAAAAAAAPVVPQQASRASRSARGRNRALLALSGAAAAVVVFTAIDPFGGATDMSDDAVGVAAAPRAEDPLQAGAAESGAADSGATAAPDDSPDPTEAPAATDGAPEAELDRISRVMTATDTPYSRDELADQADLFADGPPSPAPDAAPRWAAGDQWPAATLSGVRDCVSALPASANPVTFVDQAEFEGAPALVVARQMPDGALEVFVQDITCNAADPAIAYRTTVVP